jgi:gluconokinase
VDSKEKIKQQKGFLVMKYVLVLDVGTTNMKVAIVNEKGDIISQEVKKINLIQSAEGAAEHDPQELWANFLDISKKIITKFEGDISLLIFSGYQFGFLPIDKKGNPLMNMVTLLDTRSQNIMNEVEERFSFEEIYQKTGCPPAFNYTIARILWLKKEKPEIFARTYKFLDIKSFFTFKLTGKYYTEPSLASVTQLLDIKTQKWDEELIKRLGIDKDQLPDLVPGNVIVDTVKKEIAKEMGLEKEVPIMLGVYDGGAMILGMGGYKKSAVCNLGTTAMFRSAYNEPLLDKIGQYRLQTYALLPGMWAIGGAVNNAGVVLEWFRNNIANGMSYDQINEEALKVKAGSEGLICFPFLTGERDPRIGSLSTGSFFGLKTFHKLSHMARSIYEGVGYGLNMIKTALEENDVNLRRLTVGGSGSKSDVWIQILADIFNIPVTKSKTENATLIGESMVAFSQLGVYNDIEQAGEVMIKLGKCFEPQTSSVKTYEAYYNFFVQMIQNYRDMYNLHTQLINF